MSRLLGPVLVERLVFYWTHEYIPHLRHPRTFSEKICNRKLFNPVPRASMLADKLAVREFVAECGYPEILNEILLVTRHPEEIDFSKLPQQFVVKANHGSGWNIIVRNKDEFSQEAVINQCRIWMKSVYGFDQREYQYRDIEPAILIEKFLFDSKHGIPLDYRFFVFHGKCHLIMVEYGRLTEHTRTIYSNQWEPLEFFLKYPRKIIEKRPATLDKMIKISEDLAQGMDFVRVDLYAVNDSAIYFGEMTLTPSAGLSRFSPTAEWDYLLGSLW